MHPAMWVTILLQACGESRIFPHLTPFSYCNSTNLECSLNDKCDLAHSYAVRNCRCCINVFLISIHKMWLHYFQFIELGICSSFLIYCNLTRLKCQLQQTGCHASDPPVPPFPSSRQILRAYVQYCCYFQGPFYSHSSAFATFGLHVLNQILSQTARTALQPHRSTFCFFPSQLDSSFQFGQWQGWIIVLMNILFHKCNKRSCLLIPPYLVAYWCSRRLTGSEMRRDMVQQTSGSEMRRDVVLHGMRQRHQVTDVLMQSC